MAKIFLTGAKGQVGSEIELALLQHGHTVVSTTHETLDITNVDRVFSAVIESEADLVINAAAYTNVEKSEIEHTIAFNVNAIGARNLARACAVAKIPLIHLSTDYVFSDELNREHKEDDKTNTECAYGRSKLEGENYIINTKCKYIIVRTSWVFGRFGRNFVKIMLSMAQERSEIAVVSDQLGNPTPARPLAEAIVTMAQEAIKDDFNKWGIYHYCGKDATTWDEFARAIFHEALQLKAVPHEVNVISIKSEDFNSKAKRPRDSRLCTDKMSQAFNIQMPYWPDYLNEVINAFARECRGLTPVANYDNTITHIVDGMPIEGAVVYAGLDIEHEDGSSFKDENEDENLENTPKDQDESSSEIVKEEPAKAKE